MLFGKQTGTNVWPKRFAPRVSGRLYQFGRCFLLLPKCARRSRLSIDEYSGIFRNIYFGLDQFAKIAACLAVPGIVFQAGIVVDQ